MRNVLLALLEKWKPNAESAALSNLAAHFDITTTLLHNAVNHSQAQSCALALIFCSEEWIEDSRLYFRWHAMSRIGNRDLYVVSRRKAEQRAHCFFFVMSTSCLDLETSFV